MLSKARPRLRLNCVRSWLWLPCSYDLFLTCKCGAVGTRAEARKVAKAMARHGNVVWVSPAVRMQAWNRYAA